MKTVLNIKTDKDVKEEAQKIAREMGLPLSTIVNAYLKEFVRDACVTFTAKPETLRPEVARRLLKASGDYRKGRNISPPLSTPEEIDAYLNEEK